MIIIHIHATNFLLIHRKINIIKYNTDLTSILLFEMFKDVKFFNFPNCFGRDWRRFELEGEGGREKTKKKVKKRRWPLSPSFPLSLSLFLSFSLSLFPSFPLSLFPSFPLSLSLSLSLSPYIKLFQVRKRRNGIGENTQKITTKYIFR